METTLEGGDNIQSELEDRRPSVSQSPDLADDAGFEGAESGGDLNPAMAEVDPEAAAVNASDGDELTAAQREAEVGFNEGSSTEHSPLQQNGGASSPAHSLEAVPFHDAPSQMTRGLGSFGTMPVEPSAESEAVSSIPEEQSTPPAQMLPAASAPAPAPVQQSSLADDDLSFFLPDISEIPPVSYNIFDPHHHGNKYTHIQELVAEVDSTSTQHYLQEFSAAIEGEVLMIGSIPLEEVVEEEGRVQADGLERLSLEREALRRHKDRLNDVIEKAREKLAVMLKGKMGELRGEATRLRQQ